MAEEHELFRGVVNKTLKSVMHATIEIGPSKIDESWAFRVTVSPFVDEKACRRGIEKMKRLLEPLGFTFTPEKDYVRPESKG